jgi:hypothetical protein
MSQDYRNNREDNSSRGGNVNSEVKKLISSDQSDYAILAQLRAKFNNDEDMVQSVFDGYKEKQDYIKRKAQKFRTLMFTKYMNKNMTFDELLRKARKYKKKYDLSDSEFSLFLNLALTDKNRQFKNVLMAPNTAMSKVLGQDPTGLSGKLNVKEKELDVLQAILKIYGESRPLHSQIVLQSLTYSDCAAEAITGQFYERSQNSFDHIHPIIAALFLPRIKYLDEHMLIANLGYIVKCKYEGAPIATQPDYELYWDLITDPNNTICDMSSPLMDLKNRCIVQNQLWNNVINLRQGKYYTTGNNDFMVAIDNCKHNFYDTPDLAYIKDEGTVFRRLMSVFSVRPTIVTTTPLYGVISQNPHIPAGANVQVTSIPMVTFRLPISASQSAVGSFSFHLDDAIHQAQQFVENKMLVPKAQSIIYSRQVLFFYVARRFQALNVVTANAPYVFTRLPRTLSGFERLNTQTVNFNYQITLGNDVYDLRSVLFVNRHASAGVITGSSAGIVIPADVQEGRPDETFILYDPQTAGKKLPNGNTYNRPKPVTWLPKNTPLRAAGGRTVSSFHERAATTGTIFMYVQRQNRFGGNGGQYGATV